MKVREFIKEIGWESLADRGIDFRDYPDHGLRCLNYSQINARKDDEIAGECRGLILDMELNIVCRPFSRFFNYGEMGTGEFDFSDSIIFEKADGSMTKVYFCPQTNQWEIGTRGTAFAEANHVFGLKQDWTFREAILDAMGFTEDQFQSCMGSNKFHKSCTYVMEYTSPFNRIVTPYEKPQMVLLSVISNVSGIETPSGISTWVSVFQENEMNVRMPAIYYASSGEQLVRMAESLDNLLEGFVVFDRKTRNRVKVKSSIYVNVHYLRGNGSSSASRLIEVVLKNEQEELLGYFPEFKVFITPIEQAIDRLVEDATVIYESNKSIESQKDFAMAVKDTKVASVCFKARKDNSTALKAFNDMDLNQKQKLLEKYIEILDV